MKKIVLVVVFALLGMNANAQEQLNKNKKVEIEVNGLCDMCKKRIEKAAYSVKGVKSATWHVDHQDLHLSQRMKQGSILELNLIFYNLQRLIFSGIRSNF